MIEDDEPQPSLLERILSKKNHLGAFGITKGALKVFSEDSLRILYRGVYNINLSFEILKNLNPIEILAVLYFAGISKRANAHLDSASQSVIPPDFTGLMNYAISKFKSFGNGSYQSLMETLEFPLNSPLEERLDKILLEDKEKFTNSFFDKLRFSDKENPYANNIYPDPDNLDGYLKGIYSTLNSISRHLKKKKGIL